MCSLLAGKKRSLLVLAKINALLACSHARMLANARKGHSIPLNRALWLATRAGKMEPSWPLGTTPELWVICNGLWDWWRTSSGTTRYNLQAKFPQKPWGEDGWILASFLFCEFMDLDFVSVHKNANKKSLANIQPSSPHTWSITHTYRL